MADTSRISTEDQTTEERRPLRSSAPICRSCDGSTVCPPPTAESCPPPVDRPLRTPALNVPPPNTESVILTPVPQPLPVPRLSPPFCLQEPSKHISSPDDARRFLSSPSGVHFLGFVAALSHSVRGQKLSDPCYTSSSVAAIVALLQTLVDWVDEIPLAPQTSRYGNVAYRTWHERLGNSAESLHMGFLLEELAPATVELVPYFLDSFGNSSRIDYGTGHETNFAAWLYCLARLGLLKEEDYHAAVARIFVKYLDLMRKLQTVYSLEPAGSHGVWGLDDCHFLPFIFGSAQLIDHKYMKPKSIHNQDILDNFSEEYLYLSCVAFVNKVKKGIFAEHSPMLDDISGVPNWTKVNSGLLKMYKVEVLQKVPIMQHFLFGSIIKWLETESLRCQRS
ncbi:uncharacterized protein [Aristolochia californica]|uniref:uncharacterized protein isoform X2 n=1 Tax=Aristolochia californica TaxID=171875 RepID=UPI0035D719D1